MTDLTEIYRKLADSERKMENLDRGLSRMVGEITFAAGTTSTPNKHGGMTRTT